MFTETAATPIRLSDKELAHFEREGWVGPYPLLTAAEVAAVCRSCDTMTIPFHDDLTAAAAMPDAFVRRPWFKSLHAYLPAAATIARHPGIVQRVASLIGPNVMAWGVSTAIRLPGQTHRWHIDVEHRCWDGVTVFLGLRNISSGSSLNVISRSHRIDATPQALQVTTDEAALAASRRWQPESKLATVALKEGEFFIFHGRLWHGSHNRSNVTRMAMIAQYSRPEAKVAIPLNWDEPIRWHSYRPPCLLVSGRDSWGVNRIVAPPAE